MRLSEDQQIVESLNQILEDYALQIPLLKNIQDNFKFLPHINKNKKERKRVLNSIGIQTR